MGFIILNTNHESYTINTLKLEEDDNMADIGRKDGSQTGLKSGGRGLNRTDECRHPEKKNTSGRLVFPGGKEVI